MKLVLTCQNKQCENYLKDIEKDKKLFRYCEHGYFYKRCDKCGDIAQYVEPDELSREEEE